MEALNLRAKQFADRLVAAQNYTQQKALQEQQVDCVHVVGAGRAITSMYEQVRNAAEYTEDHLILQRAIRRFYTRLFMSRDQKRLANNGEELIIELTLAGYLPNDSVPIGEAAQISDIAQEYYEAYSTLSGKPAQTVQAWTIDILATGIDARLRDYTVRETFEQFVFEHFKDTIDAEALLGKTPSPEYDLLLFAAIHRALLKSDDATIRWSLLRRYGQQPSKIAAWQATNEHIDVILQSKQVERLRRFVSKEGAVFRVLLRTIKEENIAAGLMNQPDKFLLLFESTINATYEETEQRINRGVLRSIIFLLITKALIGVAVEIPYDFWAHDEIVWLPLAVNLLIPPVYMLLLRLTLKQPSAANTRALVSRVEQVLYAEKPITYKVAQHSRQYGVLFNAVYAVLIVAIFGAASWLLVSIGFSVVHLIIFFVFFSTASFLGFRLSRMIRELETVESGQDGVAMVRDFIYLPFVVVGRKLSESYAKFNVVTALLDMLIELPLKNALHTLRRWSAFISSKKDEL